MPWCISLMIKLIISLMIKNLLILSYLCEKHQGVSHYFIAASMSSFLISNKNNDYGFLLQRKSPLNILYLLFYRAYGCLLIFLAAIPDTYVITWGRLFVKIPGMKLPTDVTTRWFQAKNVILHSCIFHCQTEKIIWHLEKHINTTIQTMKNNALPLLEDL